MEVTATLQYKTNMVHTYTSDYERGRCQLVGALENLLGAHTRLIMVLMYTVMGALYLLLSA